VLGIDKALQVIGIIGAHWHHGKHSIGNIGAMPLDSAKIGIFANTAYDKGDDLYR
jgi:hypothetical protein